MFLDKIFIVLWWVFGLTICWNVFYEYRKTKVINKLRLVCGVVLMIANIWYLIA